MKNIFLLLFTIWQFAASSQEILKIEYFIDSDPGFGLGTEAPLPKGDSSEFVVDISQVSNGIHTLYIRVQDNSKKWSQSISHSFLKTRLAPTENSQIVSLEYFIDSVGAFGSGINIPVTPAVIDADIDIMVDLSEVPVGNHTLYVSACDNAGNWSMVMNHAFEVKESYTVTFADWDNTILKTQTIMEGDSAIAPENPVREHYTFTGWDMAFDSIYADTTVTAQYEINSYKVSFVDWDATLLKIDTVEYQSTAMAPENPTRTGYTFTRWDMAFDSIYADTTVTAQYEINSYTVTFKDWDETVLKTESVDYGGAATAPEDPTREGYTFSGWDTDFSNIITDLTVTAQYQINTYTVSFLDWDETVLKTEMVDYGNAATAPDDPEREGYIFTGWDSDFTNVTTNLTVTALYEEILYYSVTFTVTDGTNAIENATLTFNGNSFNTNASGTAVIEQVESGTYNYSVTATEFNDTSGTVTVVDANIQENVVLTPLVGIAESEADLIQLYPNPASEEITISSPEVIQSLKIVNGMGQVVYITNKSNKRHLTLNIKDYPKGIYFIHIETLDQLTRKKLILQ